MNAPEGIKIAGCDNQNIIQDVLIRCGVVTESNAAQPGEVCLLVFPGPDTANVLFGLITHHGEQFKLLLIATPILTDQDADVAKKYFCDCVTQIVGQTHFKHEVISKERDNI